MVHIHDIIPADLLEWDLAMGYVRVQTHPTLPLKIYGYTEKAQFEKKWNVSTINCRGLIADAEGNIVARPWKKFFNYGEGRLYIDDEMPVEVTDKMDGSLGILYPQVIENGYGDNWAIATRGSFASEQAIHATNVWNEKYAGTVWPTLGYTFLFEIIYPANRIVLNYSGLDDLVLLGAVNIDRGYYLGPREAAGILGWPGPQTEVFPYRNLREAFAAPMRPNAEGLVVRSGTEMVKIKQVDYVELHKIVTNLNERTVWLQLGEGKSVSEICESIPDEFHDFVQDTAEELRMQFAQIEEEVYSAYATVIHSLPSGFSRREFAEAVSGHKYKSYLFMLLDCRMIDGMIWQSIRPSALKE